MVRLILILYGILWLILLSLWWNGRAIWYFVLYDGWVGYYLAKKKDSVFLYVLPLPYTVFKMRIR